VKTALVVFDSVYGNTERVARALAKGMEDGGVEVECVRINALEFGRVGKFDLLCVGAPTQAFGVYRPVKEFLERLKNAEGLAGKKGFAFDTKIKGWWTGSAAKGIEKRLRGLGLTIVKPYVSAIVKGKEGPLEEGAEETFRQLGTELAKTL
jgi:flavorubredoxin